MEKFEVMLFTFFAKLFYDASSICEEIDVGAEHCPLIY